MTESLGFWFDQCRERDVRIAELEAELAQRDRQLAACEEENDDAWDASETAQARLAAVIAKFDGHHMYRGQCIGCVRRFGGIHYECDLTDIRAAATGDTK